MHPFLQAQLAALHQNDLRAEADAVRRFKPSGSTESGRSAAPSEVVIRRSTSSDGPALATLAALDAAPVPLGPILVAEVSGVPRAVLPLEGGRAFGDPFTRTDELVALLELRAAQIKREGSGDGRRHRLGWISAAALRRFV
jgi:hypothetical protein